MLEKHEKDIYSKFIEFIIKRNAGEKREVGKLEITKLFKKYVDYMIINDRTGKKLPIVLNIIDFLKVYYSAVRGVA